MIKSDNMLNEFEGHHVILSLQKFPSSRKAPFYPIASPFWAIHRFPRFFSKGSCYLMDIFAKERVDSPVHESPAFSTSSPQYWCQITYQNSVKFPPFNFLCITLQPSIAEGRNLGQLVLEKRFLIKIFMLLPFLSNKAIKIKDCFVFSWLHFCQKFHKKSIPEAQKNEGGSGGVREDWGRKTKISYLKKN